MSRRLLSPEKRLAFENLLTPVRNVNRMFEVARLDRRVQGPEVVAIGPGHLRSVQRVQDRLVGTRRRSTTTGCPDLPPERSDQNAGSGRERSRNATRPRLCLRRVVELRHHVLSAVLPPGGDSRCRSRAAARDDARHQSQSIVDGRSPSNSGRLPSNSSFIVSQEQALAEAPRAREEVVLPLAQEPQHVVRLVDVVAAPFPDLAERLHADGELPSGHGRGPGVRRLRAVRRGQRGRFPVLRRSVGRSSRWSVRPCAA